MLIFSQLILIIYFMDVNSFDPKVDMKGKDPRRANTVVKKNQVRV